MKNGIYEQIVNQEINKGLETGDYFFNINSSVSTEEYKKLLVEYLKEITDKALDRIKEINNDISDDDLLKKEIEIGNRVIELLRENLSFDEFKELNIAEPCEVLEYAYRKLEINSFDGKNIVRPITSLVEPSLFTNSSKEVSLLTELANEIKSSDEICMLVSFIRMSGINPLIDSIKLASKNGKRIRILTTTYMQATEQKAIKKLSNIENVQIKISYNTKNTRLHAKSYIFKRNSGFSTFYIGSSNLSSSALNSGCEWNLKLTQKKSPDIYNNVVAQFETYWNSGEFEQYIDNDECNVKLAKALDKNYTSSNDYHIQFEIEPYDYQLEILEKVKAERIIFNQHRNLIVAATGVGKTVVAAFDFKYYLNDHPDAKLLFVVHREEILKKSMDTFRVICQDLNLGELYNGRNKPHSKDILFASVDAANKLTKEVNPYYYDFIIIDEFHHAEAKTYRSILEYYKPNELLGLTATPERMDGKDILEYFDGHIAAEMRLQEAIDKRLLSPFQYFGVTDSADLSEVKWNKGGYDEEELTKIFSNGQTANMRSDLIISKLLEYSPELEEIRGIGFCVSIKHAEFMAEKFNEKGIASLAVTSETKQEIKENAINDLKNGKYKFLFAVDLYNEGVDIPCINIELMLRPTDSMTIFLQQLGRGLRLFNGKDCLTVLDFIGEVNHKFKYENKIYGLVGKNIKTPRNSVENNFPNLPAGCSIVLEEVAKERILKNIKSHKSDKTAILELLANFEENTGKDVTLSNFLDYCGINIRQFYRIKDLTFYRACKAVNIKNEYEFENDTERIIGDRLKGLLNINSEKILNYIIKIFNGEISHNEKLDDIVYYSLFSDVPKKYLFDNTKDAVDCMINSKILKNEILEIVYVLFKQIDVVPRKNNISIDVPLEVYCSYTRNQILAGFGLNNSDHHQTMLEGVMYIKDINHDIFLVTLKKDDKSFSNTTSYNDYAINRNMFHWQTQSKVSENSATLNRYVNSNGRVSLFVRVNKNDPYIYLGECNYISHEGNKPVSIVWKLINDIPGKYIGDVNSLI